MDRLPTLHVAWKSIHDYEAAVKQPPRGNSDQDADKYIEMTQKLVKEDSSYKVRRCSCNCMLYWFADEG